MPVSYETVRRWVNHFGPMIAADLRVAISCPSSESQIRARPVEERANSARGRALARALRGDRSSDLADEITHLKSIAENSGSVLLRASLEDHEAISR